jgi:transposase InsO family protein
LEKPVKQGESLLVLFVRTTDSNHSLPVYLNLARGLALSNINQLWVSDITYIRLRREFVYLAVVLDAYSRRCIGWALSRHIDTELALKALRMALETRTVPPGLIPHSDRGVQYAAADYLALLKEHKIQISMSRTGNPYDNAKAERFMRTLKYEDVYLNDTIRSLRSWPRSSISSKQSIIGSDFIPPSATCRPLGLKPCVHHQYFLNYLCHFRGALQFRCSACHKPQTACSLSLWLHLKKSSMMRWPCRSMFAPNSPKG